MFRIEFDDETLRRAIKGAAKSEKWLNPKPLSTSLHEEVRDRYCCDIKYTGALLLTYLQSTLPSD